MPELKPCPFCGGEAELIWNAVGGLAGCFNENCPVNATTPTYYVGAEYESEAAAEPHIIEAWNTRAELTCRQEERGWGTEGDHARVWLDCGHDCMVPTVQDLPNYCPSCGARVVE